MMETNDFDKILRMNTEAERRQFAAMAMQGLLANDFSVSYKECALDAVAYADALIAELNKKKD